MHGSALQQPISGAPKADMDSDRILEVAKKAKSGDKNALDTLLSYFQKPLRRIVRIRLGAKLREKIESMDIVQESLMAASQNLDKVNVDSRASILNWLSQISENRILASRQHFNAQCRDLSKEVQLSDLLGNAQEASSQSKTPLMHAEKAELDTLIDSAISKLTKSKREILIMRLYCGTNWEEVATKMQKTVPAAQEAYRRAIASLRLSVRPSAKAWIDTRS